ncbi:unnamed protein product [Plutella xylostella]|uniref:(diamondback moth) hypothetical protein n=1 Tax=Plutella xylostella TaxID=51655 RepID=A0A8S4FN51_PLUXY|nr:unnamed protein product [Plutella xylostella]
MRQTTASYVSVLTIVAFSLERYLAICHPLHLYAMAGLRRALRIVSALWAASLLAASPFALYTTVNYHDYPPGSGNVSLESAFCAMLELPAWYLCELSSLLFFVLPGLIILALYVRMGLRIRSTHASKPGSPGTLNGVNGSVHGEARQAQSKKAIIRMLVPKPKDRCDDEQSEEERVRCTCSSKPKRSAAKRSGASPHIASIIIIMPKPLVPKPKDRCDDEQSEEERYQNLKIGATTSKARRSVLGAHVRRNQSRAQRSGAERSEAERSVPPT